MKHIVFLIFAFIPTYIGYATNIANYYSSWNRKDGSKLYYITEQSLSSKSPQEKMRYDITILDSSDTVNVRFTMEKVSYQNVDSISIQYGCKYWTINDNIKIIYIEPVKQKWNLRVEVCLPYILLKDLFSTNKSFIFKVFHKQSSLEFVYDKRQWSKLCEAVSRILMIVEMNKNDI